MSRKPGAIQDKTGIKRARLQSENPLPSHCCKNTVIFRHPGNTKTRPRDQATEPATVRAFC